MLDLFVKYINDNKLFSPDNKILLGVSGGVDSVVMLNLFIRKKYNIGIAHCNFQLRGKESDDDQEFVEDLAKSEKISLFIKKFNTAEYARNNNMSIQMAARELRYGWFDEIRQKHNYMYIAVGHNMDDAIETFFINLLRGTGIRGLTGIRSKNNNVIRPLLFASRKEICKYAQGRKIHFREDSSNAETKYLRNKIRHDIIPELIKINPDFNKTMTETFERLKETEALLNKSIEKIKSDIIEKKSPDRILVDISKLASAKPVNIILFEIIRDYGFNYQTVENIISNLSDISGKQFFSKTHRIIKDRKHLMITGIRKSDYAISSIDDNIAEISHPVHLAFTRFTKPDNYILPEDKKYAVINNDKITYPVKLRKWKEGDRFMPLGMKNTKKLSDFFIDNKLSIPDKEDIWLLVSDEQIFWIVNFRIDERFKVDSKTRNILLIEYFERIL